jgi:hypothetical protein
MDCKPCSFQKWTKKEHVHLILHTTTPRAKFIHMFEKSACSLTGGKSLAKNSPSKRLHTRHHLFILPNMIEQ